MSVSVEKTGPGIDLLFLAPYWTSPLPGNSTQESNHCS